MDLFLIKKFLGERTNTGFHKDTSYA